MFSPHNTALLQALLVTFIWSLSWVFIKIGLHGIPPITFAGLRYFLAFTCLLAWVWRSPATRHEIRSLNRRAWGMLLALGVVFYTLTQGAQFAALVYLPSATLSLLLSFTPVIVALVGIVALAERPTGRQFFGIGLFLIGVVIYFYPAALPSQQAIGLVIGVVGVLANAAGSILGRYVNRDGSLSAYTVTTISMGVGAGILLVVGLVVEGFPALGIREIAIILWLAVVHTAAAFTLWNHTLRTLSAVESSIINNTMLIQIALLAWIFLGEGISLQELIGMGVVMIGALIVQLSRAQGHPAQSIVTDDDIGS